MKIEDSAGQGERKGEERKEGQVGFLSLFSPSFLAGKKRQGGHENQRSSSQTERVRKAGRIQARRRTGKPTFEATFEASRTRFDRKRKN
jgi:hypothetical protein